jgi:peptidoglycan/LPS O-acetylase OafA/YrhL
VLPKLGIPFDINYNLPEAIAWCISFMPNVFKALYEPGSILIILWSIGIEEQFYIVIAPTLKFIPQNKILLTLSIFTIAYLLAFSHIKSLQTFQLCFFYISAGGVMGIINMKFNKHLEFFFSKSKYLISILIILALTTSILDFNNLFIHHLMLCIIYCLFLALITSKAFPTIKNPSLSFLGKISYGIYMYHMIVVNLVLFIFMKLEPNLSNSITIVFINLFSIAITIIVAALSYKYYERFFLNFKTKFR